MCINFGSELMAVEANVESGSMLSVANTCWQYLCQIHIIGVLVFFWILLIYTYTPEGQVLST